MTGFDLAGTSAGRAGTGGWLWYSKIR